MITPTTELQAVNEMLRSIGESSVNSLSGEIRLDASEALEVLQSTSRDVQKRGWYWNTESYRLSPNINNKIPLPSNTLEVKSTGLTTGRKVTMRGGFLYDLTPFEQGPIFTGPVEIEVTLALGFSDLPETARRYIAMKASRIFHANTFGSEMGMRNASQEEQSAWAELRAENNTNAHRNLKEAYGVQRMLLRGVDYFYNNG